MENSILFVQIILFNIIYPEIINKQKTVQNKNLTKLLLLHLLLLFTFFFLQTNLEIATEYSNLLQSDFPYKKTL